jgi:hypothetical protein
MMTEGTREHLVFVWTPEGYGLEARPGGPPPRGAAVASGERRHCVAKVAPSPLPGDARACAYLLPVDGNGAPDADANGHQVLETPSAPEAVTAAFTLPELELEPHTSAAIVDDDLLTLFGRVPEGSCVVTVDADGRRVGLTVGTLVALSVEPPLVGFTVSTEELLAGLIPVADGCTITMLAGGQEWLAR